MRHRNFAANLYGGPHEISVLRHHVHPFQVIHGRHRENTPPDAVEHLAVLRFVVPKNR